MLFGDAPDHQGIAPPGGIAPQQLHGGAQGAAADGKDEGRMSLVAELDQHPISRPGDKLAVKFIPDVDVSEVVVRAGAVLGADELVHPALVAEGDGLKLDRRFCHIV